LLLGYELHWPVLCLLATCAAGGAGGEALEQLQAIVSSLNPLATVIACEQAKVGAARPWPTRVIGGCDGHKKGLVHGVLTQQMSTR
jgi:hypothetical protein